MSKFFKSPTLFASTLPYSVDKIHQEMEYAEVDTIMKRIDDLINTIVNAGKFGRDYIKHGDQMRSLPNVNTRN